MPLVQLQSGDIVNFTNEQDVNKLFAGLNLNPSRIVKPMNLPDGKFGAKRQVIPNKELGNTPKVNPIEDRPVSPGPTPIFGSSNIFIWLFLAGVLFVIVKGRI